MPAGSFSGYLLRMSWETSLHLCIDTDNYYHYRNWRARGATTATASDVAEGASPSQQPVPPTVIKPLRGVRGLWAEVREMLSHYVLSSSSTRLAVHGFLAAYTLWVIVHHSRCVPVRVQYANTATTSTTAAGTPLKSSTSAPAAADAAVASSSSASHAAVTGATDSSHSLGHRWKVLLKDTWAAAANESGKAVGWTWKQINDGVRLVYGSNTAVSSSATTTATAPSASNAKTVTAPTSSASMVHASSSQHPASTAAGDVLYLYESSEGMQLLMRAPLPKLWNAMHAITGMLLLPLSLYQKESLPGMCMVQSTLPKASSERSDGNTNSNSSATTPPKEQFQRDLQARKARRVVHGAVGMTMVALMTTMTAAGVAMRSYSVFSAAAADGSSSGSEGVSQRMVDFGKAILWFATPWGIFAPAVMITAKTRKALPHAVVGGLVCKACFAVPLARSLGAVYQKLTHVHVSIPRDMPSVVTAVASSSSKVLKGKSQLQQAPLIITQHAPGELERMYYASILTAAVVVGVWALYDIRAMMVKAHAQYEAVESQRSRISPSRAPM